MKSSYDILNVAVDASDDEIKQAYLQQVKIYPPDRDQQQFQLIHQAYESIKDHKSRLSYALFSIENVDFNELRDQALSIPHPAKINSEQFNTLLRASIDDEFILNTLSQSHKT